MGTAIGVKYFHRNTEKGCRYSIETNTMTMGETKVLPEKMTDEELQFNPPIVVNAGAIDIAQFEAAKASEPLKIELKPAGEVVSA